MPSSYVAERIAEARAILSDPASGPTLRWLARLVIRQWSAAA
jgi:hypothetical protein